LENNGDVSIRSLALVQIGKEESEEFESEILTFLTSKLDRDYVELGSEIDLIEAQIKVGTESNSSSQLCV
jgi:hypothetical protein